MKLKTSEILARNLKKFREERRLTSKQLAMLAGTTPNVMTAMESGTANPTLKRIESFATALNMSVSELLNN